MFVIFLEAFHKLNSSTSQIINHYFDITKDKHLEKIKLQLFMSVGCLFGNNCNQTKDYHGFQITRKFEIMDYKHDPRKKHLLI